MATPKDIKQLRVDPVSYAPITEKNGAASNFFAIQWARLVDFVGYLRDIINDVYRLENAEIIAGSGLEGGGKLKDAPLTISANASAILDQIDDTQGAVLYRGATEWEALPPGSSGEALLSGGPAADPAWGAVGGAIDIEENDTPVASGVTTINFEGGVTVTDEGGGKVTIDVTGGGGGASGGWELIASHNFTSTPQATFDVTGIDADDILVIASALTAANSGFRNVRVSIDNGSSFYSASGDYLAVSTAGATSSVTAFGLGNSSTTAAVTNMLLISPAGTAGVPKMGYNATQNGDPSSQPRVFVASTNAINAVRIGTSGAGNITGGVVYVLGRTIGVADGLDHPEVMARVSLGF